MSIKRFGRMAGSTQAMSAQSGTARPSASYPFETVEPATKMVAFGEGADSLVINRALGALGANIEDLLTLMDSPATKAELLEPEGRIGPSFYGYSSLADVVPSAGVNLGSGTYAPAVWMFVGIHEYALPRYMQLSHPPDVAGAAASALVAPLDVRLNTAAASSYFPAATYTGSSNHARPDLIPPISYVQSDLPPYAGAPQTVAIARWDTDGCYLDATTWSSLHVRPGCYVHVLSGAQQGLYLVAAISNNRHTPADDKAVLVHGLHRIDVADATPIVEGMELRWSRAAGVEANPLLRTNCAYVMKKDGNTIYLSTFAGSDEPSDTAMCKVLSSEPGVPNVGSVGMYESEDGANQAGLMGVGTVLYVPGGAASVVVTGVTPAGTPVRFAPGVVVGQSARPCSPPGFLLNPMLDLPSQAQYGRYYMQARTLTSLREKLASGPLSASLGTWFEEGSASPFTPLYQGALESRADWDRVGYQPVAVPANTVASPGGPFGPTAQILGDGYWRLRLAENPVAGHTAESDGVRAGMFLQFLYPATSAATYARVEQCVGNELWLSGVTNALWAPGLDRRLDPIVVGSSFTLGHTYEVASVLFAPYLTGGDDVLMTLAGGAITVAGDGVSATSAGAATFLTDAPAGSLLLFEDTPPFFSVVQEASDDTHLTLVNPVPPGVYAVVDRYGRPSIPTSGLNAAYHGHFSSNPLERGNGGAGRVIQLAGNYAPVELQGVSNSFYALQLRTAAGVVAGFLAVNTNTLQFGDHNTPGRIDLSSATDTSIAAALPQNILGALNASSGALKYGFANSVILGCKVDPGLGASSVSLWDNGDGVNALVGNGSYKTITSQELTPNWGTLGGAGVYYLVWDGTDLLWTKSAPVAGEATLCQLTVGAGPGYVVSGIQDMRMLLKGVNEQVDIQVGGPNAHFSTLYDAVEFLNALGDPGSGSPSRGYRILVRGSTTELQTVQFRVGGIVVEGFPGLTSVGDFPAVITWNGDRALFDLNGQSDLVFRGLSIRYHDAGAVASVTTTRLAFVNKSATAAPARAHIENVRISAVQNTRLHGFIGDTGGSALAWDGLVVRDCWFERASEFAIQLIATNGWVIDSAFHSTNTTQDPGGLGSAAGVDLYNAVNMTLSGLRLVNWGNRGVRLFATSDVRLRDCLVSGGNVNGTTTEYDGFLVKSTCVRTWITECSTSNLGLSAGIAYGADVEGQRAVVTGNDFAVNAGAVVKGGILLGAPSRYCIVDANQTNAHGISNLGASNSIGALNRDDA